MKKLTSIVIAMTLLLGVVSCGKNEASKLVGIWGVERIEYYIADYYGQPIETAFSSLEYTPGDYDNGIELVFMENKKGEWRDHDVDTIYVQVSIDPITYDTIVNPDTTLITSFTYSVDEDIPAVFVKTGKMETYMLEIEQLDDNTFIYKNEYGENIVERAIMKRLPDKSASTRGQKKSQYRLPGSFFSHKSLNE